MSAETDGQSDTQEAKAARLEPVAEARMASFGSLKGRVVLGDGWDSTQTNDTIALDFGMPARITGDGTAEPPSR